MIDHNYVLIVFNAPDEICGGHKEAKALERVATGTVRGASCGPINLTFFLSNKTKEEVSKVFNSHKLKFFLFEEKDSVHSIPKYLHHIFKDSDMVFHDDSEKPKKLSLEDQLQQALDNQQYEIAAVLRDKIEKSKNPKAKNDDNQLRELFS